MHTQANSTLAREAKRYLRMLAREDERLCPVLKRRLREVDAEVQAHGHYRHTHEELQHGARLAWRNSIRCVGRKYWPSLHVRDCRDLSSAEEIFSALIEHLYLSTNGGRIQPLITVFAPAAPGCRGIRIWNDQLIRYAGYRRSDGSVLGDPQQVAFTELARGLGWWKSERTAFDVLPLILQLPGEEPRLFEIPREAVLEVEITHPEHAWFAELGMRWHALPAIASMALEVGGLHYTAAPFSGWYMLTEIGARNLADENRYNFLPAIAQRLGLRTQSSRSLWRDRALLELNVAVLHSFTEAGVKMIDHHTATRHFVEFEACEARHGRPTFAEWSWIVPPLSGATTPVFHRTYESLELKPNFFSQPPAWDSQPVERRCPFHAYGPLQGELEARQET